MSRRWIRLAVLAVALPGPALAPVAAPAQTATKPPALGVAVQTCDTGLLALGRVAVFTASMPSVPKAVTLAIRFDLEERDGLLGPYLTVTVPNFGRWERSEPNVAGFVYSKRVEALAAPAAYRVKVRFAWLDAGGATVKTARRTSAPCRQPDLRPDLRVTRLHVGKASDGGGLYSVTVRNVGASAVTTPFLITLSGGVAHQEQEVAALAAGAAVNFVFRAPRCAAGTPVLARADPGHSVDEANERDNVARTTCPA
jgi:hypothetical protein